MDAVSQDVRETLDVLSANETRVLGCLIEKEITTPDYYPMTLNGLTAACNQKSNRYPVMALAESDVVRALESLQARGWTSTIYMAGSRVPKYRHTLPRKLTLGESETAVLCELMLRGPQTVGELRTRTERMHRFTSLERVEGVLTQLSSRTPPLVAQLPRQPGMKECRHAHLLSGTPDVEASAPPVEAATRQVRAENERIRQLEEEVVTLREELAALKNAFAEFRTQFE